GIVLFEILTGEKPYQGEDPVQVAIKHVNERVPAPSTLKPGLSVEIDRLVLSATDIDPDKRPRDAVILLEKLRELSEKLDPRKRQLSLELDLPPLAIKEPGKKDGAKRLRRDKDREVEIPKNQEAAVKKEKSSSIG
ncbi:MAG TPA: serine/threonine protein kinase, partial [Porticoccaceae bacterium]|nr:serine/threonine protein kinase [Porticoccaceae bacterium]